MTGSLPGRPETSSGAKTAPLPPDLRDRVQRVLGAPTLHAISRAPNRIKRLLLGGHSITIDGNTLDTTLQLMLATSRVSGREGLILSEDVATARRRINALAAGSPG